MKEEIKEGERRNTRGDKRRNTVGWREKHRNDVNEMLYSME